MASYGLLQGLTGVRYDAVDEILYVDSKVGDFNTFLATEYGFAEVEKKGDMIAYINILGQIPIKEIIDLGKN